MSQRNHTKRNDHASLLYAFLASFFFFAVLFVISSLSGGTSNYNAVATVSPAAAVSPAAKAIVDPFARAASSIVTITPKPGTAVGATQTFKWNSVIGATEYFVYLGTKVGGNNLFNQSIGLTTTVTISDIPQNGRYLYLKVWYKVNGKWKSNSFTYKEQIQLPITSITPPNGSTLVLQIERQDVGPVAADLGQGFIERTYQDFSWNALEFATQYHVYLGSTKGGKDIASQSASAASLDVPGGGFSPFINARIYNIPTDGRTLYLRIWFKIGTTWKYQDFTYRAPIIEEGNPGGGGPGPF